MTRLFLFGVGGSPSTTAPASTDVSVLTSSTDPFAVRPLRQVEVWSDVEAASGSSRLTTLTDVLGLQERMKLGQKGHAGREEIALRTNMESTRFSEVREGRVVRVEEHDGDVSEWRIVEVDRSRGRGGEVATVKAESITRDLYRRSPLIQRVESARSDLDFNLLGLTPTEWIDEIITPTDGFPSWVTKGTVASSDDVSLKVNLEPAGPLLDKIAEVTAHEWTLRRDGSTGYKIDLVFERGSSTDRPFVGLKRNLLSASHRTSAKEQATRVYPFGSGPDGQRATMADHRWKVTATSTASRTVTLASPSGGAGPVAFDDQLGGSTEFTQDYWLEKPDETRANITDSTTGQVLTLSTHTTLPSTGDLVTVRASSSGTELVYLDRPDTRATYGLQVRTLDRQDIPPVQNLLSDVASAYLSAWGQGSTTLPNGWSIFGTSSDVTVTKETNSDFWRHGGAAAKVVCTSSGSGLQSDEIPVSPTDLSPHFVAQLDAFPTTGTYQVQLFDVSNSTPIPTKAQDVAKNSRTGVSIRHDINPGKVNFATQGTTALRVRIVSRTTSATFHVDAAQLTQRQNSPRHMWQARGANDLWHAANDDLSNRGEPRDEYDLEAIDLYRADIESYPDDEIHLGQRIIAKDPGLDFDAELRVVGRTRELTIPGQIKLEVDQRPKTLSERLRERLIESLELADESPPQSGSDQTEGNDIRSLRGTITKDWIEANTITANEIDAGTITATELNVSQLSAISADAGIVTSGKFVSSSSTNRFLDLDASSSDPVLSHDQMKLRANGNAEFGGEVSSDEFTAGDMRVLNLLRVGDDVTSLADNRVELVGQTGVSNEMSVRILSNILGSPTEKVALVGDGGNSNPFIRWQSARPLQLDDGSANKSNNAGVVVSGSTPSGDYPDGTIWIQTT